MKSSTLIFVCINFFFASYLNAQSANQEITRKMTKAFVKSSLPGIGLAIVSKDSILYQKGIGFADTASEKPYEKSTIQNIGSISKVFIGVSLMKLVDKGKLKLDDPVSKYLPFTVMHPKFPKTPITIRHLATHSSGIRDTPGNYEFKSYYLDADRQKLKISTRGFTMAEKIFLKKIKGNERVPLGDFLKKVLEANGEWYGNGNFYDFEPGSFYEYTNIGAALAAYIVEIVSGVSYDCFTQTEIFQPFKMKSTGWFYKDVDMNRFVTRYVGKKSAIAPLYELSTYPDGGLKTTTADLSLLLMEMLRGYAGESEFLSKASFETLFKNHLSVPDGERNGIFWDVFGESGAGDIGHSGIDPGVYCFMYFSPTTGIGKILMTNATGDKNEQNTIALWEKFIRLESLFLNQ